MEHQAKRDLSRRASKKTENLFQILISHPTCLKSLMETPEECVKSVQS